MRVSRKVESFAGVESMMYTHRVTCVHIAVWVG